MLHEKEKILHKNILIIDLGTTIGRITSGDAVQPLVRRWLKTLRVRGVRDNSDAI